MASSYVNNLTTYTFDTAHNGIRHPVVIINLINLFHLPILAAALAAVRKMMSWTNSEIRSKKLTRTCNADIYHVQQHTIYFIQPNALVFFDT